MDYADELMKATRLAAELDWYVQARIPEINGKLSMAH